MKPLALAGALGGGALGAVIWAIVACLTGYEIGYLAWAVGGMVGFGCYVFGGRGQVAGCTCAGLALAAILAGKVLTIQQMVDAMGLKQFHDFLLPKAEAFVALESERDYPAFMVQNQFTKTPSVEAVREEDVLLFKLTTVPLLDDLGRNKPSLEEWQERPLVKAYFGAIKSNPPVFQILLESLGPVDFIFALLGIATAYKVCMREEAKPRTRRTSGEHTATSTSSGGAKAWTSI